MRRTPRLIGEFGKLRVFGGIPSDIARTWPALFDCAGFFNDYIPIADEHALARFFQNQVVESAFARDTNNEIVCVSYVMQETPVSLCFHAYSHPSARKPGITLNCGRMFIKYFFETFPIVRLSTVGAWENRVARITAARLGFKIEGRLRSMAPYNGEFKDCYYGSILRSEV